MTEWTLLPRIEDPNVGDVVIGRRGLSPYDFDADKLAHGYVAPLEAAKTRISTLEQIAVTGNIAPYETWAALLAITPASAGLRAEVLPTDTGTHTDPVTSATVPNSGVYASVLSGTLKWKRVYNYVGTAPDTAGLLAALPGTPSVYANFKDSTYWPNTELGTFNSVGTPRYRNHLITSNPQGLLVEPAVTQLCYKTDFAGANVGTGALPTEWSTLFSVAGLTATTLAVTSSYIDIQISGTPASTGAFGILFNGSSAGLAINDVVTGSYEIQSLLASTHTGIVSKAVGIYEINPGQTAVQLSTKQIWPEEDRLFPVSVSRAITTYANDVRHLFILNVTSGVAVLGKFRIAKIQRVKNTFVSSYVENTTTAALTRTADQPTLNSSFADTFTNQRWTVDCHFTPDRQSTGAVFLLASSTISQGIHVYMLDGRIKLLCYAPGQTDLELDLGIALPWCKNYLRVCSGPGWVSGSLNGKPASIGQFITPSLMQVIQLGWSGAGTLHGTIQLFAAYKNINNQTTSYTDGYSGYDDFDRENGPIGQPWTNDYILVDRRDNIGTADPALTKMTINNKRAIRGISGVASAVDYTGFDLRSPVKSIIARVSYATGSYAYDSVIALIGNSQGRTQVDNVVRGSLHMIWSGTDTQFAYFDEDASTTYHIPRTINHYKSIKDGNQYSIGFMIHGNGLVVLNTDGSLDRIVNAGFAAANGQYAIYEHFDIDGGGTSINNVRPSYFHAINATARLD